MTQVDDFGPLGLQDPPHDIDRCVVTIKKRSRGHDSNPGRRGRSNCRDLGRLRH